MWEIFKKWIVKDDEIGYQANSQFSTYFEQKL